MKQKTDGCSQENREVDLKVILVPKPGTYYSQLQIHDFSYYHPVEEWKTINYYADVTNQKTEADLGKVTSNTRYSFKLVSHGYIFEYLSIQNGSFSGNVDAGLINAGGYTVEFTPDGEGPVTITAYQQGAEIPPDPIGKGGYVIHHYLYNTTTKVMEDVTGKAAAGTEIDIELASVYQDTQLPVIPQEPAAEKLTVGENPDGNVATVYYKVPLTITANDASKKFGEPDPETFTATVTGLLPGDEQLTITYNVTLTEGGTLEVTNVVGAPTYYEIVKVPGAFTVETEEDKYGLGGNSYVISYNDKGVILPIAKDGSHLLMDKYAKLVDGKIWYEVYDDPLWEFVSVSGDMYYISSEYGYMNITDGGVTLSDEPCLIQAVPSGDAYALKVGVLSANVEQGNPGKGLTAFNGNPQYFKLYSEDQISTETTLPLNGGSYFIGNNSPSQPYGIEKNGKTRNLMLAAEETDKNRPQNVSMPNSNWLTAVAYYEISGDTVEPLGRADRWSFHSVKRNWYTIEANGKYLNLSSGGATLSGTPQNILLRENNGKYFFWTETDLQTASPLGLSDIYETAQSGFGSVTGRNAFSVYANESSSWHTDLTGTWAIVNTNWSSEGNFALQAKPGESGTLLSKSVVMSNGKVADAEGVTEWTFAKTGNPNWYTIQSDAGYLAVTHDGIGLSSSPTAVYVEASGSQIRLSCGDAFGVNLDRVNAGYMNSRFISYGDRSGSEWFTLARTQPDKYAYTIHHYLKDTDVKVAEDDTGEVEPDDNKIVVEEATAFLEGFEKARIADPEKLGETVIDEAQKTITIEYLIPLTAAVQDLDIWQSDWEVEGEPAYTAEFTGLYQETDKDKIRFIAEDTEDESVKTIRIDPESLPPYYILDEENSTDGKLTIYPDYSGSYVISRDMKKRRAVVGEIAGTGFLVTVDYKELKDDTVWFTTYDIPYWDIERAETPGRFTVSYRGKYLQINSGAARNNWGVNGSLSFSDSPAEILIERNAEGRYKFSNEEGFNLNIKSYDMEKGVGSYKGDTPNADNDFLELHQGDTVFDSGLQQGRYIIAYETNNTRVLLNEAVDGSKLKATPYEKMDETTVHPEGYYTFWNIRQVAGDWFTIANDDGLYLNLSDSGLSLSGSPQNLRVIGNGNTYLFSSTYDKSKGHVLDNDRGYAANGFAAKQNGGQYMTLYPNVDTTPRVTLPENEEYMLVGKFDSQLGYGVQAREKSPTHLLSQKIIKLPANNNYQRASTEADEMYWTFERVSGMEGDWYYVRAASGQYLNIAHQSASLSGTAQPLFVLREKANYGIDCYRFSDGYAVAFNNSANSEAGGFHGWANQRVTLEKNYGDWFTLRKDEVQVSFDWNAADVSAKLPEPALYCHGTEISVPAAPERAGYSFAGWATTSNGTNNVTDDGYQRYVVPSRDVTLYAIWLKQVNVSFNTNGGTGSVPSQTVLALSEITLPEYEGTREGYEFAGWALGSNLRNGTYYDILQPGDPYKVPNNDVKFYAVWYRVDYTAQLRFFIRLDGVIPTEPANYDTKQYSDVILIDSRIKEQRWVIDDKTSNRIEGNHIVNNVTDNLTALPTDEDILQVSNGKFEYDPDTQYIRWYVLKGLNDGWHVDGVILSRNQYTLSYDSNLPAGVNSVRDMPHGFEFRTDTTQITAGISVDQKMYVPKASGYTFSGWYYEKDGKIYQTGENIQVTGNVALKAIWSGGNFAVVTPGEEREYNGLPLVGKKQITITGFPDGYRAEITTADAELPSLTNVGSIQNRLDFVIYDENNRIVYRSRPAEGETNEIADAQIGKTWGTVKVTPVTVTVTPNDAEKFFGENDPALTAIVNGTLGEDTVAYEVTRDAGEDVGDYVIRTSGAAEQGNYRVTYRTGTFNIKQAEGIELTANGFEGPYDGQPHAAVASVADIEDATIEYSTDGGTTWSAGAPSITNVGEMQVQVRATKTGYASQTAEVTLKVTPKTVTIEAADAGKTYGEADPAFTGMVTGLVNEGDLGTITYSRTNDAEAVGAYTGVLTASYTENANYTVAVTAGDFTINKKAVTLAADDKSKVYGSADAALTATPKARTLANMQSQSHWVKIRTMM